MDKFEQLKAFIKDQYDCRYDTSGDEWDLAIEHQLQKILNKIEEIEKGDGNNG